MKIVALAKLVPDLVEELTIDPSGNTLDMSWVRLIVNEFDHHAIEQAILLKESCGGEVIVIAPDAEEVDEIFYAASAIGADRLIKLTDLPVPTNNPALAFVCAPLIEELQPDLVLTGVQAHDELEGQLGPLLAEQLGYPYSGYISGLTLENGHILAHKEFPGGLIAEMEIALPAILGIQAAAKPPRYVAFSRIRQARNTAKIEEMSLPLKENIPGLTVSRMFKPETGERAEMIIGDPEEVASNLIKILEERGVL